MDQQRCDRVMSRRNDPYLYIFQERVLDDGLANIDPIKWMVTQKTTKEERMVGNV